MRWDAVDILEAVAAGLGEAVDAADAEQAVYGVDSLHELALHPIIHQALRRAGYGVWPEQAYPSDRTGRRTRAQGKRCDIVLAHGTAPLADPEAEATLFGDADALPLEAAYWLEVKTVAQFTDEGPFVRYAAELLSPVRLDIRKLAQDSMILHAGLLLVLFNADVQTAESDLNIWHRKCLDKGYPVALPIVRQRRITDRIGNAVMSAALFPVRRL